MRELILMGRIIRYFKAKFKGGEALVNKSRYNIQGLNNRIIIIENNIEKELSSYEEIEGLNINIEGNDNTIIIEKPYYFFNSHIALQSHNNSRIYIKKNNCLRNFHLYVIKGSSQKINLGTNMFCDELFIIAGGTNNEAHIGDNCIFGLDTCIQLDDGHSIIDIENGNVVNPPAKNFSMGKHCWVGKSAKMTKNAQLPDNTIVGMGSIVTKKFTEENTILAGNPAKIIKRNVKWDVFKHM